VLATQHSQTLAALQHPSTMYCVCLLSSTHPCCRVLGVLPQAALLQLSRQSSPPATTLRPLPFQRWELPQRHGPRSSGVCVGFLPPDLYGLLVAAGRNRQLPSRLCIVTGEVSWGLRHDQDIASVTANVYASTGCMVASGWDHDDVGLLCR
jgi:hypothetical protein